MSHFITAVCLPRLPRFFSLNYFASNHMSVAEWADKYGTHHWQILRSSYRKLAWVGFQPTATEFCSEALTDWVIRPCIQLTLRATFLQLLQFHHLFSVTFDFGCLPSSVATFILVKFFVDNHMSGPNELINMVFTAGRFFDEAVESLPEWNLNPRPLNSVQTL